MKKLLIGLVGAAMICGCGEKDNSLKMITEATFPPYEFLRGQEIAGIDVEICRAVAEKLGDAVAVHARYIKPIDSVLLKSQRDAGMRIVSLENGSVIGGLGDAIGADLKFGWPDEFIPHGTQSELESRYGLDVDSIVKTIGCRL